MEEQNNMDFEEQKPKKTFPTKIIAVVASVVIAVGVGATALALSLGGNTEPAAHECNFGDWITTKEATCTAMGEKTRTCECGEKELFPVAKLSHFFSEWTVIDNATCREAGKESRECACGEKETRIIDKLEHSYGDWIITKDATCKEEGSKYRVCSTCDLKIESNIEKSLNHTEVIDVAVAATCSEFGKTEGKHCSVCDKILVYQKKIVKLDHTDGEWITDAEATCTTNGIKHQVCSVCNDTLRTETTNAFGHTDGEWITDAEATCTTNGSKHQSCSVCNDTIKTTVIPATGHSGGIATCTEAPICSVCDNSYNKPLGHTQGGIICLRCNNYTITLYEIGKSYTEKDDLTITLNSYTITEYEGYYAYTINYTIKNEVQNSKKLPGTFKLFFADGTGENQYGAFDYLYYGDYSTRTYTWKVLKNQTVLILEYNADSQDGFFRDTPSKNSLHWLPSNKENN